MGLDNMGDAMRGYDWQCATCKSCSVCRRKGNEVSASMLSGSSPPISMPFQASMLICDHCDRGMYAY